MKERLQEGLEKSASLPGAIPTFEGFPSAQSSIPDAERPASSDELKQALGKPKSSEERGGESATVFESIQRPETEHRQPEQSSIEPAGNEPQQRPWGLYAQPSKTGCSPVRRL